MEIIEIEILNDPTPTIDTLVLKELTTSAAIKNVLSLGLRSAKPDDYSHSIKIPGRMRFPCVKFKCDRETFEKLCGGDEISSSFVAKTSFDGKAYILEGFFITDIVEYSPEKEYEGVFSFLKTI